MIFRQQQTPGPSLAYPGQQEKIVHSSLSPEFTVRPKRFFAIGRVFLVLWSEPANALGAVTGWQSGTVLNHLGERVFSKVRRFIVIREGNGSCTALAISTYSGRGVAKRGVNKSEHVIVYTGKTPPRPQKDEFPRRNEKGMELAPIRIDPDIPQDRLDPMARLDLAAVHTVQHNIKAKSFGIVNSRSKADLLLNFRTVWMKEPHVHTSIRSAPNDKVSDEKRAPVLIGTNEGDDQIEDSEDDDDDDDDETDDDTEDDIKDEKFDDHRAIESQSKEADKHPKLDSKGGLTIR